MEFLEIKGQKLSFYPGQLTKRNNKPWHLITIRCHPYTLTTYSISSIILEKYVNGSNSFISNEL